MNVLEWVVVAACALNIALTLPALVLGETRHRIDGWIDDLGWVGLDTLISAGAIALVVGHRPAALPALVVIALITHRRTRGAFSRVLTSVRPGGAGAR